MRQLLWSVMVLAACGSSDSSGPNPASGAHVYYLNFEGQSLTAGVDDPTTNTSQLLSGSVTLPAYLAGDADRVSKIQALIDEVEAILAPYDVAVVTSRPSSGGYDMIVVGGTSQQVGLSSGLPGVAVIDCDSTLPHHISFVFDLSTGHDAARMVIASLGISHGISASTISSDCMCIVSGCTPLAGKCAIGGAGTPVSSAASCEAPGVTSMNERGEFLAAFGKHP